MSKARCILRGMRGSHARMMPLRHGMERASCGAIIARSARMQAHRKGQMKLGWLMSPTGNHPAAWLHPSAELHGANNFAHYVRLVRKAEAAKFDFVFQADAAGARDGNMRALSRAPRFMNIWEPLSLLSALVAGHRSHRPGRHDVHQLLRAIQPGAADRLARPSQRRARRLERGDLGASRGRLQLRPRRAGGSRVAL